MTEITIILITTIKVMIVIIKLLLDSVGISIVGIIISTITTMIIRATSNFCYCHYNYRTTVIILS